LKVEKIVFWRFLDEYVRSANTSVLRRTTNILPTTSN